MSDIREIFERITERYSVPIRVGSRCEANVFYRVDRLTPDDLEICGHYLAERLLKVLEPNVPQKLVNLPGGYTGLADLLAKHLGELLAEEIEVIPFSKLDPENGKSAAVRGANVILVNDVITTARSCLEAHTKTTMIGSTVLCWVALIDRTFGPGPVPVVTAFTGEPVRLLGQLL